MAMKLYLVLDEIHDGGVDEPGPDISDLAAGTAGEHIVCADLIIKGYRAFLSDQNCPYDVAVDIGERLVKVQVKTTRQPIVTPQRAGRYICYSWGVRRAGKGGRRVYGADAFDICALVALDTREIAYVTLEECGQTFQIRPTSAPPVSITSRRGDGLCVGCRCPIEERTPRCSTCTGRAWRRRHRPKLQLGKRFADYPFERALARLEGGDAHVRDVAAG